jgi:uncharacterized membrane protein YhaH (DUF805 family)
MVARKLVRYARAITADRALADALRIGQYACVLTMRRSVAAIAATAVGAPLLYTAMLAAYVTTIDLYYGVKDGSWIAVIVRLAFLAALIAAPSLTYRRFRERGVALSIALVVSLLVAFAVSLPILLWWFAGVASGFGDGVTAILGRTP